METELGEQMADQMENFINQSGMRDEYTIFVTMMAGMHRTLNQKFAGEIVIPFVREMAKRYKNGFYDERNELACRLCSLMWEALESTGMFSEGERHLPLI